MEVQTVTDPGDPKTVATTGGQEPESQQTQTDPEAGEPGALDFSDPNATKAEIERLRKENAKYRTRAKELDSQTQQLNERFSKMEKGLKTLFGEEETEMSPEETIEALQLRNEQLEVQSALREAANEYGIPANQYDYFEFLVSKKLNTLGEGEEITEEDLDEIAKQARGVGATPTTSVDGKGQNPDPTQPTGGISLEEFQAMGIMERSKLYGRDPKLYDRLKAQEEAARKR